MSDVPRGGSGAPDDAWDAWRSWTPSSSGAAAEPSAWDAWKSWQWTPGQGPPRQRPPLVAGAGRGCGSNAFGVIIALVVIFMLLSSFIGSAAGPVDLEADDLIAAIDALPVTGPPNQRPPETGAGETVTFPAPGASPAEVADQIQAVRAPTQRDSSESSTFLLYEEATVAIQAVPDGSEVVVFEDNRAATRRFPTILLLPGWSGALDTFDSRRTGGGIGGFRGGGGGLGK